MHRQHGAGVGGQQDLLVDHPEGGAGGPVDHHDDEDVGGCEAPDDEGPRGQGEGERGQEGLVEVVDPGAEHDEATAVASGGVAILLVVVVIIAQQKMVEDSPAEEGPLHGQAARQEGEEATAGLEVGVVATG